MSKPIVACLFLFTFFQLILADEVVDPHLLCSKVLCRAGRECRVLSSGLAECVCARKCPDRKHYVCGSDGIVYMNHCELHRTACIEGRHIKPVHGEPGCKRDPLNYVKSIVQKAAQEVKQYEDEHIKVPDSCHQNERNRMREFVISWMSLTARKHSWFKEGMEYEDVMENHFVESDRNGDSFLDTLEWLEYLHLNRTKSLDMNSKVILDKKLCLEALIEEGDLNQDWRLDQLEYVRLMNPDFEMSSKYCEMDKKHYEDGTKTAVDCNGCVCSCGKWICTSHACSKIPYATKEGKRNQIDNTRKESPTTTKITSETNKQYETHQKEEEKGKEEIFTYDDMDNVVP